jgi:hypothetical protein
MAPCRGGWAQNLSFALNPVWTGIGDGRLDVALASGDEAEAPPASEAVRTTRPARNEATFAVRRIADHATGVDFVGTAGSRRFRVTHRTLGPQSYDPSVLRPAGLIAELVVSGSNRATRLGADD